MKLSSSDILEEFADRCASFQVGIDFQLLGYCYINCTDYEKALGAFMKTVELDPHNTVAAENVVFCQQKLVSERSQVRGRRQQKLFHWFLFALKITGLIAREHMI
jgi:hypothetical protein